MKDLYNGDLIDSQENHPIDECLRLSIQWHSIRYDGYLGHPVCEFGIGLFIGDTPLFHDRIYQHSRGHDPDWLRPGYFAGEDDGIFLLGIFWDALMTKKKQTIEDVEPDLRLEIDPHVYSLALGSGKIDVFYSILTVIHRGGPWHGPPVGDTGPAACIGTAEENYKKFLNQLIEEAKGPDISDHQSQKIINKLIGEYERKKPMPADPNPTIPHGRHN